MADEFAATLRRLRVRAGLTQEALAERSGISVSTIRGVETGRRANPQIASVRLLAQALGLDPAEQDSLVAAASGVASGRPVPRQLPAAPAGFTGRAEELALLSKNTGTVVVSALGGTGKTALALTWAAEHIGLFPDGQLYVNLRGFGPTAHPVQPAEAQRGFLSALGVDRVPSGEDERTALYRSVTADRKLLLVLDNAAETGQVEPLLPGGSSCVVVVTSRRPLTGLIALHGAMHVPLDVLSDEDAYTLLVRRLGEARTTAEPDAVEAVIRHCAGLPLALVIIAARASVRPDVPLARMAEELAAARLDALDDDELSLRSVLSWSFRALSEEAAVLAGLLAVAPGADISAAAAESLSPWPARRLLAELETASVVSRSGDRYRMHDLVRLYASELDVPGRDEALRRVVDFYLHTALPGETSFAPSIPPIELAPPAEGCVPLALTDAQAWFDAEHHCLTEAQRVAADSGWHTHVWQLAWVLNTYHYRKDMMDAQHMTWSRAVEAATALDDTRVLCRAYRILGDASGRLHLPEAFDHLAKALAHAQELDDADELGHTHRSLTVVYHELQDHEHAVEHARTALKYYREAGNTYRETDAWNAVGYHLGRIGQYDEALAASERALRMSRARGDKQLEAATVTGMGFIHHGAGRLPESIEHFRAGAALWEEAGYGYSHASVMAQLADVLVEAGEVEEALALWRRAARQMREHRRFTEAGEVEARIAAHEA
ncbi:ATP-binding protein [Lentzea sp. CA-135723]|uniref:ATP-binding protein n=1 Tax=Lentzea sp. CA-135723 TaxID=3239950 RepID=UPI003D9088F2